MKKMLIGLLVVILGVIMVGCNKVATVENSLSEVTQIYFNSSNEDVNGNISVGEREEPYIINGTHTKNTEFSLISIKFNELLVENQINVELIVNDAKIPLVLDLNPANHYYMADLGYKLQENDKIMLNYSTFNMVFENVSKNFGVDYVKALKLAQKNLGDKMNVYYQGENFVGECYLKVLTEISGEEGQLFWVFTVVGKGNKNNIVLSTLDGSVIVSE